MKPLDAIKVTFLLLGIGIWFVGYRLDSSALMLAGMAGVVVAFLLRFVKTSPPAPRP